MRLLALAVLFSLVAVAAGTHPASADSWMPPRPKLASSEDGRWYVIVEPVENRTGAGFQLVKRAKGKPARRMPPQDRNSGLSSGPSIELEKGDRVVARGECRMPMEIRCLNAGQGFLLFETYGAVGSAAVVDMRDAAGRSRFQRRLNQLFSASRMNTFRQSVSSFWWYEGLWIDEQKRDIVILWNGSAGGGVLRVALDDGKQTDAPKSDVLTRFGRGLAQEQVDALEWALKWKVEGVLGAARRAFDDASVAPLARLHFAKLLFERDDKRGEGVFIAAANDEDLEVRAFAVQHLPLAAGVAALPLLREAMRSKDRAVRGAAEYAFRHMGTRAVPTLIEMITDESAPEDYRVGAATALWNMEPAHAISAEAALAKAAKSPLKKLAYAAGHALHRVKTFREQQAAKK